jgi:NTE family protein
LADIGFSKIGTLFGGLLIKMVRKFLIGWLLVFCLLLFEVASVTAALPEESRPRIGLALGGGSAMGFVHIGILRWLEENRIPVDYIAGTSMGGLMGGCYALGMSPAEIEQLVLEVDWNQIFNSNPPYNALEYRRKEDQQDFPAEITLGTRDWLLLPNGLSIYQVYYLLSRIALPYSTVNSFDELSIPYRCVATDLRHSQAKVLRDGSLAEAMRATMSIPVFFAPVERDGCLLVDGGLLNNVPADVVKQMGADIVIAIDCNESNAAKDLRRLDTFLFGLFNAVVVDNTREALKSADLIIRPQADEISHLDWKKAADFIAAGYQAAVSHGAELQKWSLDEVAWQDYLNRRATRKRREPLIPGAVEVRGTNQVNRKRILKLLQPLVGRPIQTEALEKILTEIMGSGFFDSIRYEMMMQDGRPTLLVTVTEKPQGPPFISFALQGNTGGDRTEINLRSRITAFNVWGDASELRLDLTAGTTAAVMAELYQPFSKTNWFRATQFTWGKTKGSFFRDETRLGDFKVYRLAAEFDLGYTFDRYSELRLGYLIGNQDISTIVGQSLVEANGAVRKLGLKWAYSKAEGDPLLQKGLNLKWRTDWYLEAPDAEDLFTITEASLKWIFPAWGRDLVFTRLAAGGTLDGATPFLQQFTLGGSLQLGTYYFDELRGPNYYLGTLGYLKCLGKPFWGGNPLYAGVFLENGGVFDSWSDPWADTDISIGLIATTVHGVVYLGTSFGDRTNGRLDLTLGQQF